MKIVRGLERIKSKPVYPVISIGNFDGVHIGHQAIIRQVTTRALEKSGTAVLVVFDPHPRSFFNPEYRLPLITTLEQRALLVKRLGIDLLVVQPFNAEFAAISARAFLEDYLVDKIGMAELVVSPKFRFGREAAGDWYFLEKGAAEYGYIFHTVKDTSLRGKPVSSSLIRSLILRGDVESARVALGRPYELYGEVYRDTRRGSELLQIPTCNIAVENDLIPPPGVYVSMAEIARGHLPSVTYIGSRPTFDSRENVVETHIVGFNGSLYGRLLHVNLFKRMRDDRKFTHMDELKKQIARDLKSVRDYFDSYPYGYKPLSGINLAPGKF